MIKSAALQQLAIEKADLVITVDCGISSHLGHQRQKSLEFIVTDHHLPSEKLHPVL